MSNEIELSNGGVALIDKSDFQFLNFWLWHHDSNGYVCRCERHNRGKLIKIMMHRVIIGAKQGDEVDHANGIRSDNRRVNLRYCSRSQNQANARIKGRNLSGFRGVHPAKRPVGWKAAIRVNGKSIHLGYFKNATKAAQAYDKAAHKHFGEFANPNFP